jgi:pimeloyl-ACP methyl ester carboxylesterase
MAGCAGLSSEDRRASADRMAATGGWQRLELAAGHFTLVAYVPDTVQPGARLTVYIEGDGLAWITASQPSLDPTPLRPVAMALALGHPHGVAAYLARPCQYVEGPAARNCSGTYWTDRRFAAEVIEASDSAVEQLKSRFGAREVELVGYSGGGAVAALVAARRHDVFRLVTVAGNLDPVRWTSIHQVSPLTHSLNPADAWPALARIPQVHFVGKQDVNIVPAVAESYVSRFPPDKRPTLRVMEGFGHTCCWAENWAELYGGLPVSAPGRHGESGSPAN